MVASVSAVAWVGDREGEDTFKVLLHVKAYCCRFALAFLSREGSESTQHVGTRNGTGACLKTHLYNLLLAEGLEGHVLPLILHQHDLTKGA